MFLELRRKLWSFLRPFCDEKFPKNLELNQYSIHCAKRRAKINQAEGIQK